MVKFKEYTILLIFQLTVIGYSQKVKVLKYGEEFTPFELRNDTLFYNRDGYDIVEQRDSVTYKKSNSSKYSKLKSSTFYLLLKSGLTIDSVEKRSEALEAFINFHFKENKKLNPHQTPTIYKSASIDGISYLNYVYGYDINHDINPKFYFHLLEKSDELNIKDTNTLPIRLYDSDLRQLDQLIDSILPIINYKNEQGLYIEVIYTDKPNIKIVPYNSCQPIININYSKNNITDIHTKISSYSWPVLVLHNEVKNYVVDLYINYETYARKVILDECKNGFQNSFKIFNEDSIYMYCDYINNKSIIYKKHNISEIYDKREIAHNTFTIEDSAYNVDEKNYKDIDNDGRIDYVLDTLKEQNLNNIHYIIQSKQNKYPSKFFENVQSMIFSYSFGKNVYYNAQSNASAYLYYIKNGINIELLSFKHRYDQFIYYDKIGAKLKLKKIQHQLYYKKLFIEKIEFYLRNSTQLFKDYKIN